MLQDRSLVPRLPAQDFCSYSRHENRRIVALCNGFRNAKDGQVSEERDSEKTSKVVTLIFAQTLNPLILNLSVRRSDNVDSR